MDLDEIPCISVENLRDSVRKPQDHNEKKTTDFIQNPQNPWETHGNLGESMDFDENPRTFGGNLRISLKIHGYLRKINDVSVEIHGILCKNHGFWCGWRRRRGG